jgi:hypothetical protein
MTNTESFDKLMDNLGDALEGKEISAVIPALTTLLAHAGVMSGVEPSSLIAFVALTITNIYGDHDNTDEVIH